MSLSCVQQCCVFDPVFKNVCFDPLLSSVVCLILHSKNVCSDPSDFSNVVLFLILYSAVLCLLILCSAVSCLLIPVFSRVVSF